MICIRADNTVSIHSDSGVKPLNWMGGGRKTILSISDNQIVAIKGKEKLVILLYKMHHSHRQDLGEEPGLWITGQEKEFQALLAAYPEQIEPSLELVRREYPTPIGPIDLLCTDAEGGWVIIEVKRAKGHIRGVDQLCRYVEIARQLPEAPGLVRGLYVAPDFSPNTIIMSKQRPEIALVRISFEQARDYRPPSRRSAILIA